MSKTHHTKTKGDLGVLKAQCRLAELGYTILIPLTEHSAYDIVVEKDGMFKRVQVKYRKKVDGTVTIPFKSSWADKNGSHIKYVDKTKIDMYAIYCPDTDGVYFFDPNDFRKSVVFRVDAPKNGQTKNIRFLKDYCHVP